jgi:general secretion pathway protein E
MDLQVLMQTVPVGGYISIYKVVTMLVLSLAWWRLLAWVDKDAPAARLPREITNLGMMGVHILAWGLVLLMPISFWWALAVFLVLMLGSFGAYIGMRNAQVGLKDLKTEIKEIKLFGSGKVKKKVGLDEVPGLVSLASKDGKQWKQPEQDNPERPVYDIVQLMMTEPLRRGMERLELTPIEGAMLTQYWVDGVVYNGGQFNRTGATSAITSLKRLARLDVEEKRKPQVGIIQTSIDGKRHEIQVHTAGSTAGESLKLMVDTQGRHNHSLEKLGMSDQQLEQLGAAISEPGGIILLCAPKGQGLTSLAYAILRRHDAFLTHILSIERDPEDDLEGITQNILSRSATPNEELEKVKWVVSQEPDALLMSGVANPKSVRELIEFASAGKRVYIGMRSGSAVDALNDFRAIVGDDELALKHLRMIVCGRLVRKLCSACKQPYQPDPETLRKLNLDHGKVGQFFQARTQPMVDQKGNPIACTFCNELRYKGRVGVYEVLAIDDEARQVVMANASANQLRSLIRKAHGRFLQEQALEMVEKGETSTQEVLRAMRGQEQDPRTGSAGAQPAAAGTGPVTGPHSSASGTFSPPSGSGTSSSQAARGGLRPGQGTQSGSHGARGEGPQKPGK